jgi:succinyl-diaminopimelate desuccinylase
MDEIELTKRLIGINFENPPCDEEKAAKFIASVLSRIGIKSEIVEIDKKRFNVIAEIGKGDGLILSSHMDTVPIGNADSWKHGPLSGEVSNGKIYGRGAVDTKGGLAVQLTLLSTFMIRSSTSFLSALSKHTPLSLCNVLSHVMYFRILPIE